MGKHQALCVSSGTPGDWYLPRILAGAGEERDDCWVYVQLSGLRYRGRVGLGADNDP